ncbi:MAG: DEAD/DEAH box helicase [Bacteroidales bacterium]|nr:DEAD/DEAH box helicase [Bacteroidales bacterium]
MIQKILDKLKITSLNRMQLAAIEAAKKSNDIVLLSPTGSGKTLGFLLPVLSSLNSDNNGVQVLVLVPARELALQIEQVFKQMNTGFKVNCFYGGHSTKTEKNNLKHPPAVLVGTPGRIAYHIHHDNFETESIHTLVLDEFDKSLEFGFKEEMSFIIKQLKKVRKRILTSATNMEEIPSFTGIKNPVELDFLNSRSPTASTLKLKYLRAEDNDKLQILFALICKLQNQSTLVFCNHREAVERIGILLAEKGLAHGIFHGGMDQEERERAVIKFRNGSHRLLITTDLASRGLDIPEIEAVVHYQLPVTKDVFTHRNGRTARMNAAGTSYLLLSATDHLPPFLNETPEVESLPEKNILPERAPWRSLYIAAGKKEKINKMDIVGMLLQKGKLAKEELGLVEVLDHSSYAAVCSSKIEKVLKLIKNEKIKNRKIRIQISE